MVGVEELVFSPCWLSCLVVGVFLCVCCCVRLFLEILDIRVSHSSACMWSDIAIVWAWCGRDL